MSGHRLDLTWVAPGPVAATFMRSRARVQILNGPIGSGKTTTCLMKLIRLAQQQAPSTTDSLANDAGKQVPVRKFRACVVRDTYRQLWKSTMQSWFKRIPRATGEFTGAENAPATHRLAFQLRDGTMVALHVDFLAIGENAVEDVLRGYEPTAFYLNEADLLTRDVLTFADGRVGRYPDMSEGGPTWSGILMDCNAPELSNWVYEDFFIRAPDELAKRDAVLFRQPDGLSPKAENLAGLPPGYYTAQVAGAPDWYVRRMIRNVPGFSRAGKPVYPEFADHLHVAPRDLLAAPSMPLLVGLDAGLNPAAVFGQRMPNGQWRILDELVGESGTGPRRFAQMLAQRLHERFGESRTIRAWADPAAAGGVDRTTDEQDWIEIVSAVAAIPVSPAPTNKPTARWEAVRAPLTRLIDGQPGLLLSPRCVVLREGFNAAYRFRRQNTVDERYTEEADKNRHSHVHDALQYLCSAGGEDVEIRERKSLRVADVARARVTHQHEWDPFA